MTKAHEILQAAEGHLRDRALRYDRDGERNIQKVVDAFLTFTGKSLTTEEGWLFMILLKIARSQQGAYRADNYEDGAAYFGLMGEAAAESHRQETQDQELKNSMCDAHKFIDKINLLEQTKRRPSFNLPKNLEVPTFSNPVRTDLQELNGLTPEEGESEQALRTQIRKKLGIESEPEPEPETVGGLHLTYQYAMRELIKHEPLQYAGADLREKVVLFLRQFILDHDLTHPSLVFELDEEGRPKDRGEY